MFGTNFWYGFLYLRRKKREHYEYADRLDNLFSMLRLIRPYTDHRGKQFCYTIACIEYRTHVNSPMWEKLWKGRWCIGERDVQPNCTGIINRQYVRVPVVSSWQAVLNRIAWSKIKFLWIFHVVRAYLERYGEMFSRSIVTMILW